jgi:hypothetical protein
MTITAKQAGLSDNPMIKGEDALASDSGETGPAVAYLRDVGSDEDPCWVVCAKGDPGAVRFESVE